MLKLIIVDKFLSSRKFCKYSSIRCGSGNLSPDTLRFVFILVFVHTNTRSRKIDVKKRKKGEGRKEEKKT